MRKFSLLSKGRLILLVLACAGFLVFGVELLISAYRIPDPFVFVMTFFSSNFIILISAALLIGFILRAAASRNPEDEE